MKRTILVVEDDPHISLGLEEILKSEDFAVTVCGRGDQAEEAVERAQPDLVLLDVMLPGLNGYEICRRLRRKRPELAVLMLTAKGQEMDKVIGLELGADDYVTKPFGVRELLARIQAVLRRKAPAPNSPGSEGKLKIGEALVDPRTFTVTRGKVTERLTPRELKLLQLFYTHPTEVMSRDHLLNEVWGYHYYGTTRTLDQVIVQLRKKLGDNAGEPKHLLTVHGVGYKLVL